MFWSSVFGALETHCDTVIPLGTQGGFLFGLGSKGPQDGVNWAEIATVLSWLLSLFIALEYILPPLLQMGSQGDSSFPVHGNFIANPAWVRAAAFPEELWWRKGGY